MATGVRASSIDKPLVRAERKNGNLYIGAQLWFLCLIEIDDRGRAASDCGSRADARNDSSGISYVVVLVIPRNATDIVMRRARWRATCVTVRQSTIMRSVRGGRGPPRIGATRDCRDAVSRESNQEARS